MHADKKSKPLRIRGQDDALPFDSRALEIDEQADGAAGGAEIVNALGGVLTGQPVDALQFDEQDVLNQDIGEVVADRTGFVCDWEGSLRGCVDVAEAEFMEQGALVDLFQETGAEGVGNFEDRTEHAFG